MTPLCKATSGPPSSSFVISSPSDAFTSGGPAVKIDAFCVMIEKSASGALSAPCPADGPRTTAANGIRPDASACACRSPGVLVVGGSSGSGGLWPAPSRSMISGMRSCSAISAIRYLFADSARPIEPPMTVKSSEPIATGLPSIIPTPATNASTSPLTKFPISVKVPSSISISMRVRAFSFPCC